jgi:Tol biopolymer transport system component/DNA-binding winged helix-turn-helix (wHTH) protein
VHEPVPQPVYRFEGFRLDAQRRVLFGPDGHPIPLTPRLFDALLYFVERPGELLTKKQLLDAIWPRVVVEEHNLNKTISELRRVLGEKPDQHKFFVTKPGHGYRFVAKVSIAPVPAPSSPAADDKLAKEHLETSGDQVPSEAGSEPIATAKGRPWWSRKLLLIGGAIAAVAVLAAGMGLGVFDASTPHSNPGLRVTPLRFEKDGGEIPYAVGSTVWKPDGKAIAFAATRDMTFPPQPYVLYLDGSSPEPLTRRFAGGLPKLWTPAGQVLLDTFRGPNEASGSGGLWTVPAVGGEPEPLFMVPTGTSNILSISADGSTLAAFRRGEDGDLGVWVGSIAGGTLQRYEPAPFASTRVVNVPSLSFSPDGRLLLLMENPTSGEQAWLMPYPPDPRHPPHRILESLPSHLGTPHFSWLPDNRHIVVSAAERGTRRHLYLADTVSGKFRPLTDGTSTAQQYGPVASPDGTRLVFTEFTVNLDIVTLNVHTAEVTPLIATSRDEDMPAWTASGRRLVYVADRNGEPEIWLREQDKGDRPLVTSRDFPPGTTEYFLAPEVSPDGTRVMYLRVESDARGSTTAHLWMSSLTGGAPMRLRSGAANGERAGSWSPDGAWYAYQELTDGGLFLKRVRVSGTSEPETLATSGASPVVPVWSPDGRWILFDDNGLKLAPADGGPTRELGVKDALCAFALTPELLYCIDDRSGASKLVERTFDGVVRIVGSVSPEHRPAASVGPGLRLSLTPDGEGVTYAVGNRRAQLLLADGLAEVPLP